MAPNELNAWQHRLLISGAMAARLLWTPYGTYRNWLAGRRSIPPAIALLTRYVEKYGPLPPQKDTPNAYDTDGDR